jgi:hypothetical protein
MRRAGALIAGHMSAIEPGSQRFADAIASWRDTVPSTALPSLFPLWVAKIPLPDLLDVSSMARNLIDLGRKTKRGLSAAEPVGLV